ncbi:MarR family transcriptional regulator [Rhodococcus sp. Eu-32]|uniref:MarR family transcriptional regulator n=1 Tax=Rhodococcus sp. Eu-32 TaxID=1017319 RepID=UPI000DF3E7BE|nr:MarR family transcriptional regulator [Rhodococcus sp. Eu-32]RRQ27440.1 MarR family transcriptional regulator [Rhodococcus sp. Eu-32]
MTPTAQESFSILHSIRVKGLATDPVLAAMVGMSPEDLHSRLKPLVAEHLVVRREGRMSGSMLTPVGKEKHADLLALMTPGPAVNDFYEAFLPLNRRFKKICSAWQMRDEVTPNDHADPEYDAGVIEDLALVHDELAALLVPLGAEDSRMSLYGPRLTAALERIRGGDRGAFARPMNDSYHDIWMELHQDLLLVSGRARGEHDE